MTPQPFGSPLTTLGLVALCALGLASCSKSPAELDAPASSAPAAPAVEPLTWTVPATWTSVIDGGSGTKKATYKIRKTGDDKEDAELVVAYFGTGSKGDAKTNVDEWFGQFDGDAAKTATRDTLTVGSNAIEIIETSGTFKVPLGPQIGPKKKAPMQMVKENFRMLGAVVKTPERGNWFFRMTGPNETVLSQRSAFRTMLESVK